MGSDDGEIIHEGAVKKFSLGRNGGLTFIHENWRSRHMKISSDELSYHRSKGGSKLNGCHLGAIGLVYEKPGITEHKKADKKEPMIMLRFWDEGTRDLLIKCKNKEDKDVWVKKLKEALKPYTVQFVS